MCSPLTALGVGLLASESALAHVGLLAGHTLSPDADLKYAHFTQIFLVKLFDPAMIMCKYSRQSGAHRSALFHETTRISCDAPRTENTM